MKRRAESGGIVVVGAEISDLEADAEGFELWDDGEPMSLDAKAADDAEQVAYHERSARCSSDSGERAFHRRHAARFRSDLRAHSSQAKQRAHSGRWRRGPSREARRSAPRTRGSRRTTRSGTSNRGDPDPSDESDVDSGDPAGGCP